MNNFLVGIIGNDLIMRRLIRGITGGLTGHLIMFLAGGFSGDQNLLIVLLVFLAGAIPTAVLTPKALIKFIGLFFIFAGSVIFLGLNHTELSKAWGILLALLGFAPWLPQIKEASKRK